MKTRCLRFWVLFFLWASFVSAFFGKSALCDIQRLCPGELLKEAVLFPEDFESQEKKVSESWMGIYMDGIKVGYSLSQEFTLVLNHQEYTKEFDKSWMRITRLGGNPVELTTVQESLYDAQGNPLECVFRTQMSESEMVMKAEIQEGKIVFKSGDQVVKEISYEKPFYLGIPMKTIVEKDGLKQGQTYTFQILDFTTHSLVDTTLEVIGPEDVMVLGQKMNLWRVKGKMDSIIPISSDEWLDEGGRVVKSVSRSSFTSLTSIRMPKEKALEVSDENFDIAFSTLIKANIVFENPRRVQRVKYRLSGIPSERIKNLPFDGRSQMILDLGKDYAVIQTSSQIFKEEEAVMLPVTEERFQDYLKPTSFCQSDDPEIQKTAEDIIKGEKNSWKAAKKIAEWVRQEMTPNYDVGFADAREILRNREGDCSEHTVISVALCRAAGIPARAAVGIMSAQGIFAYHMWPEVYVGRWISLDSKWLAVDEDTGEYYTDATHIKFGESLLDENIFKEMAQAVSDVIGKLQLEILDYHLDK